MIEKIIEVELPVDETLVIQKNHYAPYSDERGKRISIVTGIHGDELEGQFVCFEVGRRIKEHPEYLTGTVDIYPALNPFGIDSITRGLPAFDLDMNRIFPGNKDGDMYEYLTYKVVKDLLGSDLCIDIHASNIYLTEVPQIRINELHEKELMPYAMQSNIDLVWVHGTSTVLESTLAFSLNSRHVPTLVVEMGVGMRITHEYGIQMTEGIFRLMKEMNIWDGPVAEVRTPVVSKNPSDVIFINAPVSGIFIKAVSHGSTVKKGQHIGYIVDPLHSEILADIKAPDSGWLFTIREYPVLDEGSLIARILHTKSYDTGGVYEEENHS